MSVTAYKYAGTAADGGGGGSIWANPNNAKADDTSFSNITVLKNNATNYLLLTNFGFSSSDIPDGATINGFEAEINRYADAAGSLNDSGLYLSSGGSAVGSNLASATKWPSSQGTVTYGSSSNMWGTTLTQTDIVATGFGIRLRIIDSTNSQNAYVDYIKIRVYYTAGGGSPVFLPNIMKHNFIPPLIGGY